MHTKKHSPGVAACGSGTDWSSCRRSLDSLFPRIQTDVARQPPIHLSIHLSSAAADHSIIQRSTSVYSSQSRITVHLSRPVNVVRARQSHRRQSHVVGVDRMGGHKQWTAWPEWPSPGVSTAGKISHSLRGGRARGTLRRQRDAIWGASCHRLGPQTQFYDQLAICETRPLWNELRIGSWLGQHATTRVWLLQQQQPLTKTR